MEHSLKPPIKDGNCQLDGSSMEFLDMLLAASYIYMTVSLQLEYAKLELGFWAQLFSY